MPGGKDAAIRYRQAFTLFRRRNPSGKVVYYFQTYDEAGKRTVARSTGQTSEATAKLYCMGLWREGKLLPPSEPRRVPTLGEFATNFWAPDSEYLKYRQQRESAISPGHAANQNRYCSGYIIPSLGKSRLDAITAPQVEAWFFGLRDQGLANQSCNHLLSNLRTIMAEAARKGHITANPVDAIKPLSKDAKSRGILSTEEARELLGSEGRIKYWASSQLYVINLMAAMTGMRMGELQALRWEDMVPHPSPDRIIIRHSWDRRFGLKTTKSGKERVVPLPPVLWNHLEQMTEKSKRIGFVFANTTDTGPVHETLLTQGYYEALALFGISETERRERNITFHGWRHYFNTWLRRAGVQDSKVQLVIGHASTAMTDHYTHFDITDLEDIRNAQEGLLGAC